MDFSIQYYEKIVYLYFKLVYHHIISCRPSIYCWVVFGPATGADSSTCCYVAHIFLYYRVRDMAYTKRLPVVTCYWKKFFFLNCATVVLDIQKSVLKNWAYLTTLHSRSWPSLEEATSIRCTCTPCQNIKIRHTRFFKQLAQVRYCSQCCGSDMLFLIPDPGSRNQQCEQNISHLTQNLSIWTPNIG